MNKELRAVLNVIDEALAQQNDVSKQLWNVLTALRGPDNNDFSFGGLKKTGTVPIRRAAFPRTAKAAESQRSAENERYGYTNVYANGADFTRAGYVEPDRNKADFGHAHSHIRLAAIALGLQDED